MGYYANLVPFLGTVLGKNYEVALLDCRSKKIVAIANGHNSGRDIGAPMTNLADRFMTHRDWEKASFVANYAGLAHDNKVLRSSTFFITSQGELIGMLCINVDTSDYQKISELALMLGGMTREMAGSPGIGITEHETFLDNVSYAISQVLHDIYGSHVPDVFPREDRMMILSHLQERKIFLVKGSVPRVAQLLHCSEPTIYRNLSKLSASGKIDAESAPVLV